MNEDPIRESELIINDDGTVFHLHLYPEDIADKIIVVGDPGRVDMVAEHFDSIELTRQSREFRTITGTFKGKRVTALSHGIGSDNIDIVVTELDALANVNFSTRMIKREPRSLTMLRIGTCGACQPEIEVGSCIFSEVSVGFDGVLHWYKDGEKHMLKDFGEAFERHMALPDTLARPYFVRSSEKLASRFRGWTVRGLTMSAPGFYGPQGRSIRMELTVPDFISRLESFEFGGYKVTNIEMESAALAGMSAVLGHEAATVCLAVANRYAGAVNPDYKKLMDNLVEKSLEAVV